MGLDVIRDSTVGYFVNRLSGGKLLPYPDQRPDFVVPPAFLETLPVKLDGTTVSNKTSSSSLKDIEQAELSVPGSGDAEKGLSTSTIMVNDQLEKTKSADPFLVDWYGDDDPENPMNWSPMKRAFFGFNIGFLTFSVYIGSAIYSPSIEGIMDDFNVSLTLATLGFSIYIIGYGIGPMFLAPLQEMPLLGRNPIYMLTLFLFIIFQIPVITATNIQTIIVCRFITGFFASPALATGAASLADVYPVAQLPYVIGIWALGGIGGPIAGPVAGGYAAQANGWRWPMYELIWIASFAFIVLVLLLPETYGPTILKRRAERLRKLTGNQQLRSLSERTHEHTSMSAIMKESLFRPFILTMEPMLIFGHLYLGFVYSVFYLWFEAFPLVFNDIYHFSLGASGLPFLGFVVSGAITYAGYCAYTKYYIIPLYIKAAEDGGEVAPEKRLEVGLFGAFFIPVSVLIFGFTAKENIHWMAPVVGAALYLPGIYLIFQSVLLYMSMTYPAYSASVLAGNNLFRSTIASVFPLFGRAFFKNLGLGPGSGLLAGISVIAIPPFWALIKWGHVLRKRSKYTG